LVIDKKVQQADQADSTRRKKSSYTLLFLSTSLLIISYIIFILLSYVAYETGKIDGYYEKSLEIKTKSQNSKKKLENNSDAMKSHPLFNELDKKYLDTEVENLISIKSSEDIKRKRRELIKFIWGEDQLPKDIFPSKINKNFYDERYKSLYINGNSLRKINHILIEMDYSLQSNIYHFIPKKQNGKLVLFHQGHNGDFIINIKLIKNLLIEGYSVAGFCMPLLGLNNKPRIFFQRFGYLKLSTHDHIKFLLPEKGHHIKYFIEPVVRFLNYSSDKYEDVAMIGISGGAWTTTLLAAVDDRVKHSFPVAGSYPIYLRSDSLRDWSDYEQTIPELYRICNYLEIYILGAYGQGRKQLQIINQYDNCCFAGIKWKTYYSYLKQISFNMNKMDWNLFMDNSHMSHRISQKSQTKIFSILNRYSQN